MKNNNKILGFSFAVFLVSYCTLSVANIQDILPNKTITVADNTQDAITLSRSGTDDQANIICLQHRALMVREDILKAGAGNDCQALAPVGQTISTDCAAQMQAPATPACGYTFYQDRTILACKAAMPAQMSDNTVYKYVLCRSLEKKDQLFWVRFLGKSELPESIQQDSPAK